MHVWMSIHDRLGRVLSLEGDWEDKMGTRDEEGGEELCWPLHTYTNYLIYYKGLSNE